MEVQHLGLFVLAGWLLNLTPGPDVLYIVSSALRSGARAGVVAALGITAGCFVHIFAAAVGVSALLAASATAFTVLKWVGALYLLFVGWRMLWSKKSAAPGAAELPMQALVKANLKSVFLSGFWTNALNPKVALFFLAFVPQFIAPEASHKAWTFFLLGVLFNFNALPVNLGYALLAAWAARRMTALQRGMHTLERVAGVIFIGFGLKLAVSANPAG